MDDLFFVNVSSLSVRKEPSNENSKVVLLRDTIVKIKKTRQYKKEEWDLIETVSKPILSGYVPKKYITKI